MKDHGSKAMNDWADRSIRQCVRLGYVPKVFVALRIDHGTRGAFRKLLMSGHVESGLDRVIELGHPQLSVEWATVNLFRDEFTRGEVEAARWKFNFAIETSRGARRPNRARPYGERFRPRPVNP